MIKFCFHGVGHGLFYTGEIDDFRFVYDCGTQSKIGKAALSKAIDGLAAENVDIDFVVISHLHADHIKGLRELARKCKIRKIYLPYFEIKTCLDAFKFVLFSNGYCEKRGDNWIIDDVFYDDYYFLIGENPNERMEIEFVSSDMMIPCKIPYWEFSLFNKATDQNNIKQLDLNIKNLIKNLGLNTVEDYVREYGLDSRIKNIYKTIFGEDSNKEVNPTSLILLHRPHICNFFRNRWWAQWCFSFPQTLLTGDIFFDDDLNNRVLSKMINRHFYNVCQIPHHGSYGNWASMSHNIRVKIDDAVIPCDYGSKHPDARVVCELQNIGSKILYTYKNNPFYY